VQVEQFVTEVVGKSCVGRAHEAQCATQFNECGIDAVKASVNTDGMAPELVLVVGSQNSSNSQRLVEVARAGGAASYLIDGVDDLDPAWLAGKPRVALTAGASAPEILVREVLEFLETQGYTRKGSEVPTDEGVVFALPPQIR
jgi:4-hydroxy-3-methylbut-2-enyl diphosphate reductase IspH